MPVIQSLRKRRRLEGEKFRIIPFSATQKFEASLGGGEHLATLLAGSSGLSVEQS